MVKEARFSFPFHDRSIGDIGGRDDVYADLDELVGDDHLPPVSPARRTHRQTPIQKQTDRRHLAGADWLTDTGFTEEE